LLIVKAKTFPGGQDLTMIRVKKQVQCKCLQIDNAFSHAWFIDVFGITAVVGAQKCPPPLPQKLVQGRDVEEYVTSCEGVGMLDVD